MEEIGNLTELQRAFLLTGLEEEAREMRRKAKGAER